MLMLLMALVAGLKPLTHLEEHFTRQVKVVGTTMVGVSRGEASGVLELTAWGVDLPGPSPEKLCVSLATRDGRYTGYQVFDVSGAARGFNPLALKSDFADELRGYSAADLAVRAQLRPDCDEGFGDAYVAATTLATAVSPRLKVAVNLKYAQATVDLLDQDGRALLAAPAPCGRLAAGANTFYDHECRLDVPSNVAERIRQVRLNIRGAGGSPRTETFRFVFGR